MVVIIRGGGSQSDLSWFDNYTIAYTITQFPIPVITGIGHDKDMSVTDMVSSKSLKTPTAVADFLINCIEESESSIIEMSSLIKESARIVVERNKNLIDSYKIRLLPAISLTMSEIKNRLSGTIIELVTSARKYLFRTAQIPVHQESRLLSAIKSFSAAEKAELERRKQNLYTFTINFLSRNITSMEVLRNSLNMLDPESVLKRGYTITSINGRILKSGYQLKHDDLIDTQFIKGSVKSKVVKKMDNNN